MEMPTLPVYEVEFLPLERRLRERRRHPASAARHEPERRRADRRQGSRCQDEGATPRA